MFCKKGVVKDLAKFAGKPLAQVLFCEYYQIFKSTFFCRTSPVAASRKIRANSLKLEKFQFQLFLATLDSWAPSKL